MEAEILNITDRHFYFALPAELYLRIENKRAILNLKKHCHLSKPMQLSSPFKKGWLTGKSSLPNNFLPL